MKFKANTVFKSLRADMTSNHAFPLPGEWTQTSRWMGPVDQDERRIKAHCWGLHLAKEEFLIYWLGTRNFVAEYKGDVSETKDVVASEFARLKEEIYFSNASLADLAMRYCDVIKDFGARLEFDWTIAKTMQQSFVLSKAFLKAQQRMEFPIPRIVTAFADLCAWNAELRHKDAMNSVQYSYGCEAVEHASRALALLPQMGSANGAENIATLKEIAYSVRNAVSKAVQEHFYRADYNDSERRPLPDFLVQWVENPGRLQPQDAAMVAVGKWQNELLMKKAQVKLA